MREGLTIEEIIAIHEILSENREDLIKIIRNRNCFLAATNALGSVIGLGTANAEEKIRFLYSGTRHTLELHDWILPIDPENAIKSINFEILKVGILWNNQTYYGEITKELCNVCGITHFMPHSDPKWAYLVG